LSLFAHVREAAHVDNLRSRKRKTYIRSIQISSAYYYLIPKSRNIQYTFKGIEEEFEVIGINKLAY